MMKSWNELNAYEQVLLWWEYCANFDDVTEQPTFLEFDEMMRDF